MPTERMLVMLDLDLKETVSEIAVEHPIDSGIEYDTKPFYRRKNR